MGIYARVALFLMALTVLLGCAWKGYVLGEKAGKASVQALWDKEKLKQTEDSEKSKTDALKKERALQKTIDKQRKEAAHEVDVLMAQRDAALGELRQRPERQALNSSSPINPGAKPGSSPSRCTGAELYREDAEFLIGEAARADRTKAELKKCLARSESVEKGLNSE